jgi:hypothetical protein
MHAKPMLTNPRPAAGGKARILPSTRDGLLHLGMRHTRLEDEIERSTKLPRDAKDLVTWMLANRQQILESKYEQVACYLRLREAGSFYRDLGYRNFDELLIGLDLPVGHTLASWEQLLRLFDKETYLLIGEDLLQEMIHVVRLNVDNADERMLHYQTILENYAAEFPAFEKTTFRSHINWYVNKRLVTPAPNTRAAANPLARPARPVPSNTSLETRVVTVDGGKLAHGNTTGPVTHTIIAKKCKSCSALEKQVTACARTLTEATEHIAMLETLIIEGLGPSYVPVRPAALAAAE